MNFSFLSLINSFARVTSAVNNIFLKGSKFSSIGVTIDGDINSFSMGEATSLPLTVGVQMFIEGKINKNGVHTPESPIIDPKIFFDYFKKGAGDNFILNTIITKRT